MNAVSSIREVACRRLAVSAAALSVAFGACDERAPLGSGDPGGSTIVSAGGPPEPEPVTATPVVNPCPDRDGDGVCDGQDTCPLGDDAVDSNGNGVADACEYLLGFFESGSAGSQRTVPDRLSFFMRYADEDRLSPIDNGACKGVRLENGLDVGTGFRGHLDVTAATDPGFAPFTACMTDGVQQYMWTGFDEDGVGGFANGSLDRPVGKLENGAPDLKGARILYVRLVVIQTDTTPNGQLTQMLVRYRWELYGYRETL